jgi:DNA repair exonuclease SbcCD ATPase subunit
MSNIIKKGGKSITIDWREPADDIAYLAALHTLLKQYVKVNSRPAFKNQLFRDRLTDILDTSDSDLPVMQKVTKVLELFKKIIKPKTGVRSYGSWNGHESYLYALANSGIQEYDLMLKRQLLQGQKILLDQYSELIKDKDAEISTLTEQKTHFDEANALTNVTILNLSGKVQMQEKQLTEQAQTIKELNAEKASMATTLSEQLADKEKQLQKKQLTIDNLSNQIAQLKNKKKELEENLNVIKASHVPAYFGDSPSVKIKELEDEKAALQQQVKTLEQKNSEQACEIAAKDSLIIRLKEWVANAFIKFSKSMNSTEQTDAEALLEGKLAPKNAANTKANDGFIKHLLKGIIHHHQPSTDFPDAVIAFDTNDKQPYNEQLLPPSTLQRT